jgi:hypothetical protein
MVIHYSINAYQSLEALVKFIESNNTAGAGLRWFHKYEKFILKHLKYANLNPRCKNKTFQELLLNCLYYKDWIIAFSLNDSEITIEAILHKSRIKD